jgi:hypothetical protein
MPYISNLKKINPENDSNAITLGYLNNQIGADDGIASLDNLGQIPINQLSINKLIFQGSWDASMNHPFLTDNSGNTGDNYIVCVDGSANIQGETNWNIGDWIIFTTQGWEKIFNNNIGPKGDIGEKGINGLKGDNGSKGEKGIIGSKGVRGLEGENGEKGIIGLKGMKGIRGLKGVNGIIGIKGETGENGNQGLKGEVGEMGATGETGIKGLKGDQGLKGEIGDQGLKGATGDKGELQGETGDQGLKGETGANGNNGVNGDIGVPGSNGMTGDKGENGDIGVPGSNGSTGNQGINGDQGIQGIKGDTGPLPELITDTELINEYVADVSGLIHPANAQYIEFHLIGGGAGGTNNAFGKVGQTINGTSNSVNINGDGSRIVVSNQAAASNRGYVYIYEYNGTDWVQLGQTLQGDNTGDRFGSSVSMNDVGNIISIGAIVYNSNRGLIRSYQYNGSLWSQIGQDIIGLSINALLGQSVNLDSTGTILVTGARGRRSMYAYQYNGSSWVQLGSAITKNSIYPDFGQETHVNSTGQTIAASSYGFNSNRGAVTVYRFQSSNWVQLGSDILGEATGDYSGYSLEINADGTIIVIGSIFASSSLGQVRVFQYVGNNWVKIGQNIDGLITLENLGRGTSINSIGNIIAIAGWSGFSYIYEYDSINLIWVLITTLVGTDRFGQTTSLNNEGNMVAISARSYVEVHKQLTISGGKSGQQKKIKRKLPNDFSFTIGSGGDPYNNGNDTILRNGTGTIIAAAAGGNGQLNNINAGGKGIYNNYGAGGNGNNEFGGADSGSSGIVIITYS